MDTELFVFGDILDVSRVGDQDNDVIFDDFYETQSEQNLSEDMYDELCEKYGLKCQYVSRTMENVDGVIGEDLYSSFTGLMMFPVKLYPLDFRSYNPSAAFQKSQYTSNDKIRMHVVKKRIELEAKKHLGIDNFEPMPGDIFLIEMTNDIWRIEFNEPEAQYYDRGRAFVWEFRCQRFSYSGELMETGDDRFDSIQDVDNFDIIEDPENATGDNYRVKVATEDPVDPIIDPDEDNFFEGCV